jgi:hypothetical protein
MNDMIVADGGRRPRFSQEPLAGGRRGGEFRDHHLDGDDAV